MRRVLILGGTGWLGREIAAQALADGAEVTCLARGSSGDVPPGARLVVADRTREGAFAGLNGDFDEVVEVAYQAELVVPALAALAGRAAHWTLVSSVSVYADNASPLAGESAEVVDPVDLTRYPDAKVAAERRSLAALGDRLLIVRPGLIVGPGDPSDRFGYWPMRLSQGGRVAIPDPAGLHVQVIDVADLAAWIARAGTLTGVVNAVGPIHTLADFFSLAVEVTGFEGVLVPVDDETLLAAGIAYWAGPRSLPLWLPRSEVGFAQRDPSTFLRLGGTPRRLADSISRALTDELTRGAGRSRRSGLTLAQEAAVLADLGGSPLQR